VVGRILGVLLCLGILGGVAYVALSTRAERDESGRVVEGGEVDVMDIGVGDCTALVGEADMEEGEYFEVDSMDAVPCDEPHVHEAFAVLESPEPDGASFPGSDVLFDRALVDCLEPFEAYVGVEYEASALYYEALIPTEGSWDLGDRESICYLRNEDSTTITGSAKGTGW
jgi:hypothetical protein